MYYLFGFVVVVILLLAGMAYSKNMTTVTIKPPVPVVLDTTQQKFLSLKDIQKQLEVVAKTPPPKNLSPGAMCYTMAGPPDRIEYICPVCGEKSIYSSENQKSASDKEIQKQWTIIGTLQELEGCRRLIDQIDDKISAALDESQFCRHCSPDTTDPSLGLTVHYPKENLTHRYQGIDWSDLRLIRGFIDGKVVYKGFTDEEISIVKHLDRVKALLVVTDEEREDKFLSRQEVQEKLKQVAQSPAPQNLKMGAMCYEVAFDTTRIDYVCPNCHEKTIYAHEPSNPGLKPDRSDHADLWTLKDLEPCRRIAGQIKHLSIKLDESQFCKKCSPKTANPKIRLIVSYPGQKESPAPVEIQKADMQTLKAFMDGQSYYQTDQERQVAIKSCLPRLEAILGITISDTEKP